MKHIVRRTACGVLSAALLASTAFATSVTPSAYTIILPQGQTSFTFDIRVNADNAFAGVEFALKPSSADAVFSVEYLGEFDGGFAPDTMKNGIYYFGTFKSASNSFAAKTDYTVATVTCQYSGEEDMTITLVDSDIISVDTANKVTVSDDSADAFTITVDWEGNDSAGGGSTGGGSTGGGSTGEETEPETPEEPSVEIPDFTDVSESDWFAASVNYVVEHGLMSGTSDTTFAPNSDMTRAMIVTVLARMEGVNTDGGSTWYEIGRQWAMENGISDGTNMMDNLTREQLAAMLYRYVGEPAVSGTITGFADVEKISGWAEEAMLWAVQNGIISGSGNNLNPQGYATRAEVATMLMRFCEL